MSFRESLASALLTLGFVFAAALVGWHALRRYRAIMVEAERLGERSNCPSCHAYAAFKMIREHPRMNVRCRKCGSEWLLDA